jgi:alkylresorcinol/alkylpyrone synthase
MSRLISVATAVPRFAVAQSEALAAARVMFEGRVPHLDRLLKVFENAGIDRRYFAVPLAWFQKAHPAEEVNRIFIETATDLSAQAIRKALDGCGLQPADVDYLVFVNTTGLATPSIDARLINVLGCRTTIARTPIWGRGCAGGVAGLAHVNDYLLGRPDQIGVIVAAEFCGLTFLADDYSKSNVVASALFGDGVGAAVLAGSSVRKEGLEIVATRSRLFPDSLKVMGWNITSRGMQVVFDRRIPAIVTRHAAAELDALLASAGLDRGSVEHYLYHPGGVKVLEAYEKAYGIGPDILSRSRDVLRCYGNMSSATVLFVIERFLEGGPPAGYGVISALGPGFSSESVLFQA